MVPAVPTRSSISVRVKLATTKSKVSPTKAASEAASAWKYRIPNGSCSSADSARSRFWGALADVFPDTVHQRCWVHKMANVMNALPKSAQPAARATLQAVRDAEDREHAEKALERFAKDYEAKWPKAVEKITKDREALLAFFDFPAEHWVHLKTTNPMESSFATVRLRTKVTKGPGPRAAGLAMAYKLIESAQTRWRAINAPHLVALVRAGVKFEKGVMVERSEEQNEGVAA
jgi:transposase-like protein